MYILIVTGSPRKESVSSEIGKWIQDNFHLKHFDLAKEQLPIFDDTQETNDLPEVKKFISQMKCADAYIIVTPEYHGGMSGALKNAIDFMNYRIIEDKPVLPIAVAGGGKGGINALNNLRTVLRALYADVVPKQMIIDANTFYDKGVKDKLIRLINEFLQKKCEVSSREVMGL